MAKTMEEIEDVNKRILKNRNETEKLKAELQDLINEGLGLGETSKLQQQNESKDVKDPPPNKVQIIKAYDGQCSSKIVKKEIITQVPSKECMKKAKTYNVEEAREYIKKQKQKRLEQLKLNSKENKQQTEIKQKKLQELHKKAIELVQRNVDANRRSRSKSRERTDFIRLDVDHLPRSKSASKTSAKKNEQLHVEECMPQGIMPKINEIPGSQCMKTSNMIEMPKSKSVKVLQNITLLAGSSCNLEEKAQETENELSPRDKKQNVQCDNIRNSKETQTTKPEKHFPKWLEETPIESSPHNVINTFRKKLEYAATCPKLNIDVGAQNCIDHRPGQEIPELKLSTTPKCLNLDPKTVEHFELKCSASPSMSHLSESGSDTSKNIPDISSESGATAKKITESVASDVSFSINTFKIDNMQLKKGRTITIQSEAPVLIITDENGYSFNHQALEDRRKSIISLGSPEGQGYRCSKNKASSSIKTDTQFTPTHSRNIPNLKSKSNTATPQNSDSNSKSYHQKATSQMSKVNKATPQNSDSISKSYHQKSPSQISKSSSKEHEYSELRKTDSTLQRPDIFVNTRRGSGSYSIDNDLFEENETSEAPASDSDINTEISHTNHSKMELSSSKITSTERNSDKNNAAEILPLKEPTVSLSTIDKNRMIQDDNKSRVLKNICVRTNRQDENPNEIHLKFEAEIHLLNDFNESLRQFVEVEKAFETLKNNTVNKKYLATKDTQTSVKSLDNSENPIVSSVNYSRGSISEAPVNSALESSDSSLILTGLELSNIDISNKSSSVKSSVGKLDVANSCEDHFTKISLNLFEQMIKDEDVRLENLKTILKIREQALLDRTKGVLAWLEIQRKHLKETGKLQEASTIKKKQRGILLNLQKERNEMQRLKQMQKAASAERKTALKEQSRQLRKQLVTTNMLSRMKINSPRERRLSGPIKVIQSKTESIRSETSMSRISSDREKEVYSIASHQSIVSRVSEFSEIEVSSKAIESEVENKQAFIRKNLLMKEVALSKRRKAAEELLQCHQKLLEEEKRVVELESMAKSIICPKNDVTKKRKTWSVPTPIGVPKQSDEIPVEYASDFEVESIVEAVDQNIKDLMNDFSKVQDNISMLGISKSSKSDEDENREEENSVIESKRPNKTSTGTISSISSSVSGSVVPDHSERLSKTFCAKTSEAPSHIDGELSIHTITEHSVVPEVSEKISSLLSPKTKEKYSTTPEVSEKLSQPSNYVSNASGSKVSEQICENVPSKISETNNVSEYSEKLTKSIDGSLDVLTDRISQPIVSKQSQVAENTGISEKISESPNEETNISDNVFSPKSSVVSDLPEKPFGSQATIKSDIASVSKTSVKLSEEILNSLQGHGSNTSSAPSLHIFSEKLPEAENLSSIPKTESNSHTILSEKNDRERTKSTKSSRKGQFDVSVMPNSTAFPHSINKTLSDDNISVVPEDLKNKSDPLSVIQDSSRNSETEAASHSSDKIEYRRSGEDRSQATTNDEVSEDISYVLQEERDKASKVQSSAASIHISERSLPEDGTAEVSVVPEVIEEMSDSAKINATSHNSEETLYKDSIKKTQSLPDSSLVASNEIKPSVKSNSEIMPELSAEASSAGVSERLSEVPRRDSKNLKETGASQTLSNVSSVELNGNILTVADDVTQRDCTPESSRNETQYTPDEIIGKHSEESNNKDLVESELKDTEEIPSNGAESLSEAYNDTQGSRYIPNVTEENKTSELEASRISTKNEGELAPKSTISGIIEEALKEVCGMDETVYKYFAEAAATGGPKNDSKSGDTEKSESIDQEVEIIPESEEEKRATYRSDLEQLQNDEVISKHIANSSQDSKLVEGIPANEESFTSEPDANEKSIDVLGNEDKGSSRAELRESELKDIIHKAVKEGLFSVLESATNLDSALEGSISEHFPKTAEEHKSTEIRNRSDEETNDSDETEQKSLIEKDSLKETDIDEELSLDASEEHIITSLTILDKISDASISKSCSNKGILDLSYGAVETSFSKEEINSYEEKEQDSLSPQNDEDPASVEEVCSVSQESVKSVDVKKRVLEIMTDANLTRGDKSPRLQDIYTTTYDLASPTNSPEYGSPIDVNKNTRPVSIFGDEAEEIFKKQLAIEQEIKAITEQQQKEQRLPFLFVREIPNKPPPPYTPPSSLPPVPPVQPVVPTRDEIDEITKYASKILYKAHLGGKLEKVTISDSTFVFDLCKEICRWHYEQFEDSTCPSWLKVTRKPKLAVKKPLDAAGLEKHMTKKLRELYGYEKPIIRENAIIKWCKKKRNNIDEILITESLQEESQWTTFEKDDKLVMDQITNEIMNMLLIKETEEVFRNVFCRKILQK
nr:unnamed protein product [Callosobruchus chinensis]